MMKYIVYLVIAAFMCFLLYGCQSRKVDSDPRIVFLHHSVGSYIWRGDEPSLPEKIASKVSIRLSVMISKLSRAHLPILIKDYNKKQHKNYFIKEEVFPRIRPYGWHNYPYDYYNIWVKNQGDKPFLKEPTLEILTKKYDVIIFKHCFRVSNIKDDLDSANINSDIKTIANYKLQYLALRDKLTQFPQTKFILFTGAVNVKSKMSEEEANRTREFFDWVINEWDLANDNIYLWDLYSLQTEGGLYFNENYALSSEDSHPNKSFADKANLLLFNRIIDVIENNGTKTLLTGEKLDY